MQERKKNRLTEYDYSQDGVYYITICTQDRRCILSRIHSGNEWERSSVELSELGQIVADVLTELSEQYGIRLEACSVMPNHIHLILFTENSEIKVGRFVGAVKSVAANRWRKICESRNVLMGKIWQRDYYDHILRNEADYLEKLKYIDENLDKWMQDELYGKW